MYLSLDEQVCIIGKSDNFYICWCSITPICDGGTNASIFEYDTLQKDKTISNVNNALGSKYTEVNSWHKLHINKRRYKIDPFKKIGASLPIVSITTVNRYRF